MDSYGIQDSRAGYSEWGEERWGVSIIETPSEGGHQQHLCILLRKLPGWLASVHPNKVSPDIRPRVIAYQNECDDVLWRHWSGQRQAAAAPPPPLTAPARFVVSVDSNGTITTSPMTNMAPEGYALVELDLLQRITAGAISLRYMYDVGMGIVHDLEKATGRALYNHDPGTPLALACAARGSK
ncbi:hypothetical protein CCP3SC15_4220005 [Gammaproteobacteria bacterium]